MKHDFRVIGALGLVSADSTPAYVEAIVVDDAGHIAHRTQNGYEPSDITFNFEGSSFVPLPVGLPVDPTRNALLLSARDVEVIVSSRLSSASSATRDAVNWMNQRGSSVESGFAWLCGGHYAALLVTRETWGELRRQLLAGAEAELREALAKNHLQNATDLAWRVVRSARGDRQGMALAALAFASCGLSEFHDLCQTLIDRQAE